MDLTCHNSEAVRLPGASANDPKLSDGGGWRDGCAGEGGGAASVTAGAVRCSAWLGVSGFIREGSRASEDPACGRCRRARRGTSRRARNPGR